MDSLITAAARALASGDAIGALKRVALRDDAPALALRMESEVFLCPSRMGLARPTLGAADCVCERNSIPLITDAIFEAAVRTVRCMHCEVISNDMSQAPHDQLLVIYVPAALGSQAANPEFEAFLLQEHRAQMPKMRTVKPCPHLHALPHRFFVYSTPDFASRLAFVSFTLH